MQSKMDGQNILFIIMLVLILMLSYCAIPDKDEAPDPWETAKTAHMEDAAHGDGDGEAAHADHAAVETAHGEDESGVEEDAADTHDSDDGHGEAVEQDTAEEKEPAVDAHAPEETAAPAHEEPAEEAGHEADKAADEDAVETTEAEKAPAAEPAEEAAEAPAPAAGSAIDAMVMNTPEYESHKKPIVIFTHKKHAEEYGVSCGSCHHDDMAEPLDDLTMDDDVPRCIDCHSEPGKAPKEVDGKKLSASEKLAYHTDALHANCITCHKTYNKENNTKAAPASCSACHDKNRKPPAAPVVTAPAAEAAPAPEQPEAVEVEEKAAEAPASAEGEVDAPAEKEPAAADGAEAKAPAADTSEPVAEAAPEGAAAADAGSSAADVIAMNNPDYEHKKGIVQFTHKKHFEDYGIGCGDCHHDDSGAPLEDLKMGDGVEGCIACHSEPGKAPREVDGKKLSNSEKLEYHTDALHANCITCHKAYNKENNTKAAPASCTKCHPKE